jgi:DNA-binding response OmpR family regulator
MRVLIVEENHKIVSVFKRGLEQESFIVDVAFRGLNGLELALNVKYDLMILDYLLSGEIDALAICKRVRQKNIHTPIILIKDKIQEKNVGSDVGVDDYLIKPFAFEELLAKVNVLLRSSNATFTEVLKVDNLTLDRKKFLVMRSNRRIFLTKKEFLLLEYLMRNAGRVLTKNLIISHVWNFDTKILPNTVEVYIGYLRKKIDKPFPKEKPMIKTVHGFGYRIGEESVI